MITESCTHLNTQFDKSLFLIELEKFLSPSSYQFIGSPSTLAEPAVRALPTQSAQLNSTLEPKPEGVTPQSQANMGDARALQDPPESAPADLSDAILGTSTESPVHSLSIPLAGQANLMSTTPSHTETPAPKSENTAPGPNLTLRIASGFFAAVGIAAIIAAFLMINAATLGTVLICAGVGVTVTLVSLGFFASTFPTEPANSPALQQ